MNIKSLGKIAVKGTTTCRWCNKVPATWFDIDPRDPAGYIAICNTCYQNPRVNRTYTIHVEGGKAVMVLKNGHGGKTARVRVGPATLARIQAIENEDGATTADEVIGKALDAYETSKQLVKTGAMREVIYTCPCGFTTEDPQGLFTHVNTCTVAKQGLVAALNKINAANREMSSGSSKERNMGDAYNGSSGASGNWNHGKHEKAGE